MLTISKNILILLSLTALHPSNTFGGNVHEDLSTEQHLRGVQTLQNEIKSIKDDIKDLNRKIDRPGGGSFKGKLLRNILPSVNIVLQESRLLEPNMEVDTELDDNSLFDARRQEPNRSSFNRRPDPDNSVDTLRGMQEQIRTFEILLNKTLNSKENNEIQSNTRNYDEHFNCIRNCSSSGSIPQSCSQATAANSFKDDVYLLQGPQSDSKPFYVYCAHEKENEKGWMIIQRREDGSVNFNRNWLDYKLGFGDLNGEYWIGLERLHQITSSRPHELWISLYDYEEGNQSRYAKYSEFIVGSEDEGYKLTLGGYEGDADDSFKFHNSVKFSTFDKDNDASFKNCARKFHGGWWYLHCYHVNLNGIYYSFANKNSRLGIYWNDWHGYDYSLRYVHMGIRPKEA